jgi:hypothetical protein
MNIDQCQGPVGFTLMFVARRATAESSALSKAQNCVLSPTVPDLAVLAQEEHDLDVVEAELGREQTFEGATAQPD